MTNEGYHEPVELLDDEARDIHRAIVSLMEELEAIDWYRQRVAATSDKELRQILEHNADEEKEHAVMVLEWLRRRDPHLDAQLRTYLFSDGDVTKLEEDAVDADQAGERSLGIGSMREEGD